jgi:hypothetical protein
MLANKAILPEQANCRGSDPKLSPRFPQTHPGRQKDVQGKAEPLSFGEVTTGRTGGIRSMPMATLVQNFGVDLELKADT